MTDPEQRSPPASPSPARDPAAGGAGTSLVRRLWHNERRLRITTTLLGIVLCAAAGTFALHRSGGGLVALSYDIPFLVRDAGGAEDIRIVYLDELAGDVLDRRVQASLLDALREAGARAVLYDIIFDREWPDPEVDASFAAAIRRFRGVDEEGNPVAGAKSGKVLLACGREQFEQAGVIGERLIPPTDLLLAAAGDDFGLVALSHTDYVVRELVNGSIDEPSMAWKAAVALGADLEGSERLSERWINYAGPPTDPDEEDAVASIYSFPASVVLGDLNPSLLRDSIVIVGGKPGIVSPMLGEDLFRTPFHALDFRGRLPYMSGVEIQANVLANLLQGNWLERTSHSSDLVLIVAVALLSGLGLARLRPFPAILVAVAGVVFLALAGVTVMHFGGTWFPWTVAAFVQLPVALVGSVASHFYIERFFRAKLTEEQEKLRDAFERYVSPQMLHRILGEDFHLKLGGEKVEAAILFTDIESFTEMCQIVRDPETIVENLNGYLERTTHHVFEHDGVVIKYIGDAIFAAWGVPFADADAAPKAVRAAWKLFEHAKFVLEGRELRTRVGIHFGEVVAGNIGSSRHIDYTLIGDSVNLASRLENLNKMLETSLLLSEEVIARLGDEFRTRRVGRFRVKGRQDETIVHELLGPASDAVATGWVETYNEALAAFEEGDRVKALERFRETDRTRLGGDGPSRFFLKLIQSGEEVPDGVVELREK